MKPTRPRCEALETREPLSGLHALKHAHAPAPKLARHPAVQLSTTKLHASHAASPTPASPATNASTPPTNPTFAPTAPIPTSSSTSSGATLSFATRQTNPDVGPTYDFRGVGTFGPLASGKVVGSIETAGSVATGRAGGTLTFSDAQGAIVLKLTGPAQTSGTSLPGQLDYTIWGGYGSYAGVQGTGTVDLQASADSSTLGFHPNR